MFASWNHHDFLVKLDSQLAMCLWTFWVLLHRHPATPTLNRLPGTMHYPKGPTINRASRPIGLNGRLPAQLVCHLVGCRSEDFKYQSTFEPCLPRSLSPSSLLYTTGPHCRLAIRSRHHWAKSPKSNRLYMEPEARTFMVPGQKAKKIKILNFFVSTHSGSCGGQIRSVEVIQGH